MIKLFDIKYCADNVIGIGCDTNISSGDYLSNCMILSITSTEYSKGFVGGAWSRTSYSENNYKGNIKINSDKYIDIFKYLDGYILKSKKSEYYYDHIYLNLKEMVISGCSTTHFDDLEKVESIKIKIC